MDFSFGYRFIHMFNIFITINGWLFICFVGHFQSSCMTNCKQMYDSKLAWSFEKCSEISLYILWEVNDRSESRIVINWKRLIDFIYGTDCPQI